MSGPEDEFGVDNIGPDGEFLDDVELTGPASDDPQDFLWENDDYERDTDGDFSYGDQW